MTAPRPTRAVAPSRLAAIWELAALEPIGLALQASDPAKAYQDLQNWRSRNPRPELRGIAIRQTEALPGANLVMVRTELLGPGPGRGSSALALLD